MPSTTSDALPGPPPAEAPALRKGEIITVTVDSLSGEGTSVGRHEGIVCFVEHAVPGDTAAVRLFKIKKQYLAGRAVEILRPSPLRTQPECMHFGVCGGCRWQSLAYDAQLDFKRRRVKDAFERIGGFPDVDVLPVKGCPEPYRYRNKMEYTFSGERWLTAAELGEVGGNAADGEPETGLFLGLHPPERFDKVVELRQCLLPSPTAEAIMLATGEYFRAAGLDPWSTRTHAGYLRHLVVREGKRTGETMVNLVTTTERSDVTGPYVSHMVARFPAITTIVNNITDRKSMVALGDREVVLHGAGTIRERIGGYTYRISANSFFQTNSGQAETLFDTVVEMAQFTSDDVVYDLYCGTGAIAIYISGHTGRVLGVEASASAVADAERNAAGNNVANCRFVQAALPGGLEASAGSAGFPNPTAVVVDPPRNGLHQKLIEAIVRLAPARVVYVSCNAATQARDAKLFAAAGYAPGPVQPVDMFPHTDHVETVTVLARSR